MQREGLRAAIVQAVAGGRFGSPPFRALNDDGTEGLLRRQCTSEYKLAPIFAKCRELIGLSKGQRAPKVPVITQWIGISTDEAHRMKPSQEKWIDKRHPLIEVGMSRNDCLRWMERNGYPKPAKSACTFCPYHDDSLWRDMKMNDPESFADAVEIDELIRNGVRGTTQKLFVHRSLKPLAEVDFRSAEDAGQYALFGDECEGLCGN
jgi:hypothetical protein